MKKRGLLILLSVLLLVGVFSGCTSSKKTSESQVTTLTWMLPGDHFSAAAEEEVHRTFNQKLAEVLPGVQVEFEVVPFSEYSQRFQLATAAKEKLDLVWSGYLISYVTEATNGSFLALDELLNEYGQDMLKEIPEWAWEQQKLNGKIYSVPNMQQVAREGRALFFQKDQGEKYMDREKLTAVLNEGPTMTREGWDAIGEYLETLKQNGELKKGVSTSSIPKMIGMMRDDTLVDNFKILRGDDGIKVWHLFETPDMQLAFDVMSEWYKKGYIVENVASMESPSQYEFNEDGNVLWAHNYFKDIELGYQKGQSKYVDVIPLKNQGPYIEMSAAATSTAIVAYSENAEKAVQLLDLMNTKKGAELFNLLAFGIENKHYKLVDGNRVEAIRDEKNSPLYWLNRWVVGNVFNGYEQVADPDNWYNYLQTEVQGPDIERSPLLGFKPDVSMLSTELAHIKAIEGEYYRSLCDGALPDYKATYKEMMEKLKIAGLDKVKTELQSQIDEWLKANKK